MNFKFEKYSDDKRDLWEQINTVAENSTFLSSIHWIEFQKSLGRHIDQYFIFKEEGASEPVGIIYIEKFNRKFVKFAYSPYGPVIRNSEMGIGTENGIDMELLKSLKSFMQEYIKERNLTLFRFDPLWPKSYLQNLSKIGFRQALAPAQAKDIWELDLTKSEDELRSGMGKSTRYNINKTTKSGIEIVKASLTEHVKAFADLMQETTGRKNFGNYNYGYFQKQFDALNSKGMTNIYLAKFEGKFLAGALINYYKDTAYYTHGCSTSDRELSKLRAPYLLQWTIMRESKSKGFKKYNMWGVLPESMSESERLRNPMNGVSEFKRSFGGYEINYVGAVETFVNPRKYDLHRTYDWWIYRKDRY